jgi:hypothetical protein
VPALRTVIFFMLLSLELVTPFPDAGATGPPGEAREIEAGW